MSPIRAALALAALCALGSCATLSEEECRSADWYRIGLADGAEGRPTSWIENHRRACADVGVVPDPARWLEGREAGLRLYCTPAKAYEIGSEGRAIAAGCSSAELAAMRPAHAKGLRYHEIGREIDGVAAGIRAIERRLAALPPGAAAERAALLAERSRLQARLFFLEVEQQAYAGWP